MQKIMPLLNKKPSHLAGFAGMNKHIRSLSHEYSGSMKNHLLMQEKCGPINADMLLKYFYGERANVMLELDMQEFENWNGDMYDPSESEEEDEISDSDMEDSDNLFQDITMSYHNSQDNDGNNSGLKSESKEAPLYKVMQPNAPCLKAISAFCKAQGNGLASRLNPDVKLPRLQVKVYNTETTMRRLRILSGCEIGLEIADRSVVDLSSLPSDGVFVSYINAQRAGISPSGLRNIVKLINETGNQLTHLELAFNQVGVEGARMLSEALMNPNNRLTHLGLRDAQLTDDGVALVSQSLNSDNCNIIYLDLVFNQISAEGVYHVSKTLKHNSKLRHLGIEYNAIGDHGTEMIAEALRNPESKLEMLYLGYTDMTTDGLALLLSALDKSSSKWLDLKGNDLGDDGAALIGRYLSKGRNKVTHYDLSGCNINEDGGRFIADSLKVIHNGVVGLQLASNNLSNEGASYLASALTHPNNGLQVLGLNKNGINSDGTILEIADALESEHCHLEYLIFGKSSLNWGALSRLQRAAAKKKINLKLLKN